MNPHKASQWDPEDERNRTGERLVVRPNAPPSEREERTTVLDELDAPFSQPDSDALPTQPDLEVPPAPPAAALESFLEEPAPDSEDFRDTIPAPVPPEEI